jgi:putative FmdB family regulatory protein
MARYDYRCTSCGKVFEVTHGMRERPEVVCPDCGAAASRAFSASGIVLKGSGFYNTDQRGSSATPATGAGKDCASEKPAGDAKASEPAAKPAESKPAASVSSKPE